MSASTPGIGVGEGAPPEAPETDDVVVGAGVVGMDGVGCAAGEAGVAHAVARRSAINAAPLPSGSAARASTSDVIERSAFGAVIADL